ncbi:putative cellobiose dehydrogenase [Xylariaceae sp. FL0016]|nr:putative cellobiose dehydrogenase [Xylariaceae sp. FL0016]
MRRFLSLAVAFYLISLSSAAIAPFQRRNTTDWKTQEWDVIIVGAGTAGIIIADRLSEAGKKTLLLEVGDPSYGVTGGTEKPDWLNGTSLSRVDVPGLYKSIFSGGSDLLCPSDVVGGFQACTVGGNSAINAGLYLQPPASDWDDYHPAGWKSADVKDATQRLLGVQPSVTRYSQDGKFYWQTGYAAARSWLVDGAGFSDVAFNEDPDNKDMVFGRPVYNYIEGQRGGPARTYLQSALKRSNFRLQTGVRVKRIKHSGTTATGVNAIIDGLEVIIPLAIGGRVVVSAGALASPGLLMHSSIGPTEILGNLSSAGLISSDSSGWIVNSQVGEGLFDNPNTYIELSDPSIVASYHNYDDPDVKDKDLYLSSRSGPYAFASQTSAFWGYVYNGNSSRIGVQGTIDSFGHGEYTDNNTITLNIYGTSGLGSAGRVVLSSDGNFTPGPSDDVYYSHPSDGQAIAQFIHTIFQALPSSTPSSLAPEGLTPLNLARNSTVDEIYTYITTSSEYARGETQHWSSSCRLGQCVDSDTKVIGTKNIHVVDASIVAPLTVNPQFGVMIAAEKGAERILATWE